jgi:hypothetical protein
MIAYRGREANGQEQRGGLRKVFPLQKAAYFDTEFTLISGYLHKSLDRLGYLTVLPLVDMFRNKKLQLDVSLENNHTIYSIFNLPLQL